MLSAAQLNHMTTDFASKILQFSRFFLRYIISVLHFKAESIE